MGLIGGYRPQTGGPGGVGVVQGAYRFGASPFAIEALLGAGAFAWPAETIERIEAGGRYYLLGRREGLSAYWALDFVHLHEEPVAAVPADPIGSLAGTSAAIHHRTGMLTGPGLSWRVPLPGPPMALNVRADVEGLLPTPGEPDWYVELGYWFAIRF